MTTLWHCPRCGLHDATVEVRPHSRFHHCAALGLTAPMLKIGVKAELVVREREDYVGDERVVLDARGRPVMSIETRYPDGRNDALVFAPTALGSIKED
jgi:hypothetical protein